MCFDFAVKIEILSGNHPYPFKVIKKMEESQALK